MLPGPFVNPPSDGSDPDRRDPDDSQESDGVLPGHSASEPGDGFAQQGLFLTVPAGSFDADQFTQSGPAADMPPDPLLATIIDTVTGPDRAGLTGLSDDQLIGVIAAVRRLESRIAWYQLAAVAEFTARTAREPLAAEFAPNELACELHLTRASAADQMDYARTITTRLPHCLAALADGRLHPVHLRIIEDETSVLSAENAARADAALAESAGSLTFGKLRAAAHRLVLELDPEAAQKRKDAARRDAHVRPFPEPSGNAGMVARELPPDEVLASWQHVEQRALDLRAAGLPGTLRELRVRAYLDLLQERDTRLTTPRPVHDSDGNAPASGGRPADGGRPDSGGRPAGGGRPADGPGPSLAALVTITVPWSTLTGQSSSPADVSGLGVADAADARDLAAAAARDPRTRWCVTALHPDGTAAAHGCAPGRHPPPGTTNPITPAGPGPGPASGPGPAPGPDPPPGPSMQDWMAALRITMTPVARGTCHHQQAEPGYRPSRNLTHLVRARNPRCTAPGCSRPAARCDLDHTVPWDQGGLTCECDLAPLCRHHHRCKQAEGWHLAQPEPGVLVWRTPAGRTYVTTPARYLGPPSIIAS